MSASIHIELNALCLLLLCTIVYQSRKNYNQQMSRLLFRITAYGIIGQLILDILWRLIEGCIFPGAVFANRVINALYLGIGVCLGCIWYLYVLETLGHKITRRLQTVVMLPGLFFTFLNLLSVWTGWVFTVSPRKHLCARTAFLAADDRRIRDAAHFICPYPPVFGRAPEQTGAAA